jgi:hypothetical protein
MDLFIVYNIIGYKFERIEGLYTSEKLAQEAVEDMREASHTNLPSFQKLKTDIEVSDSVYVTYSVDRGRSEMFNSLAQSASEAKQYTSPDPAFRKYIKLRLDTPRSAEEDIKQQESSDCMGVGRDPRSPFG